MRKQLPLMLCFTWAVAASPVHAADADDGDARLVAEARKSVVLLVPYLDGSLSHATGFVVARPGDGKKVILTAGHVYQKGMTLSAHVPGMTQPIPCELISVSAKDDLMAVWPLRDIDAPALPVLGAKDDQPALSDHIIAVGCPGGLDRSFFPGQINADPITAAELEKSQGPLSAKGKSSPSGDALLLRHCAFSTPGMSGAPIIDKHGRVIGVQLGTLPKASNVCFAVHAKQFADLDLNAEHTPFSDGPTMAADIGSVLSIEKHADEPLVIKTDEEELDARCYHLGYVPKDAKTVISRYIQDEARFNDLFTEERLQKLLDATPVAHITNPTFGFDVLVPKGYHYQIEKSKDPAGVIVTFTSGDPTVAAPYGTITVRAFLNTKYYARAARLFQDSLANGKVHYPEGSEDDPFLRTAYRYGALSGLQFGMVGVWFTHRVLGIRVKTKEGQIYGPPDADLFDERGRNFAALNGTDWVRINYDAEEGPMAHAVHTAVSGNVIVLVHFQFLKKDREKFLAGEEPSSNFLEREFIASSVSLY